VKRIATTLMAAAALACAGAPVLAAPDAGPDMRFPSRRTTDLTERARNQPYWALLAECAGVFGAAANYETARGNAAQAEKYGQTGTAMMGEAMHRLIVDRGMSQKDAMGVAAQQVYIGRDQGAALLKAGTHDYSVFNMKRSACMDIDDVYHQNRNR
jgi:hypothetical protein